MNQAFRHLDRRGVGKIPVSDALRAVRGVINKRRQLAADEAFDSLLFGDGGGSDGGSGGGNGNGSDCQTLEPAVLAQLYRAEAHPDVVSGARTQQEVFQEFLEAFEGTVGRALTLQNLVDPLWNCTHVFSEKLLENSIGSFWR